MEEELKDKINMFIHKEVEKRCYEIELKNKELKEKYDGLWKIYTSEANELKKENKYRKNQIKELKKELKAKKELLRYYQKKSW